MDASRRTASGGTGSLKCISCSSNPGKPQYLGMCKNCYERGFKAYSHQTEPKQLARPVPKPSSQKNGGGIGAKKLRDQCRSPGCYYFGPKENGFYCSKCYSERKRLGQIPLAAPADAQEMVAGNSSPGLVLERGENDPPKCIQKNGVPAQCNFVDPIPEALVCPVCLLPFRDPHLLDCCGAKYCAECIGRVKESGQPCPICREHQFNTMLDKNDQRKVLGLRVRCSKTDEGCEWMGELRRLNHHEKEECKWALVKCRHECGELVFLCRLTEHEEDECPQRPMEVKMESLMRKMEDRHKLEMAAVREEFRKTIETKNEEIRQLQQSLNKVNMSLSVEEQMSMRKRNAVRGADRNCYEHGTAGEHDTVSDFKATKRNDAGARYDGGSSQASQQKYVKGSGNVPRSEQLNDRVIALDADERIRSPPRPTQERWNEARRPSNSHLPSSGYPHQDGKPAAYSSPSSGLPPPGASDYLQTRGPHGGSYHSPGAAAYPPAAGGSGYPPYPGSAASYAGARYDGSSSQASQQKYVKGSGNVPRSEQLNDRVIALDADERIKSPPRPTQERWNEARRPSNSHLPSSGYPHQDDKAAAYPSPSSGHPPPGASDYLQTRGPHGGSYQPPGAAAYPPAAGGSGYPPYSGGAASYAGARYDGGSSQASQQQYPAATARGVGRSDEKVLPKTLCRTTGCSFYAVPEYNYYCQHCWKP